MAGRLICPMIEKIAIVKELENTLHPKLNQRTEYSDVEP
jgi:hypothetical protein